ncbi:hypothetical protein SLEP1_g43160 [Rubroshorea leprosula]|uniref:DUF4219 domain-containing protein n=1 Tax=Rubroshorea leprosula TaxID=152421 RepID=A0AAV5LCE7_9ROSI|nr:hypothetical protein SLEP1_g43160 [Rubroshorea leprosula]
MEIATPPPNTIVQEVLEKKNYRRWSILLKHYLVAQDVWDVIEPRPMTEETDERVWSRKNALALHAIKISCGAKAFDRIEKIDSAKDAWEALLDMQKPQVYYEIAELHEVLSLDITEPYQTGFISLFFFLSKSI